MTIGEEELGRIPLRTMRDRHFRNWAEIVISFALLILLFAVGILAGIVLDLKGVQSRQATEAYQNRSVICMVALSLDLPLGDEGSPCLEPEVLRYYNPREVPPANVNSEKFQQIRADICDVLQLHGAGCEADSEDGQ